MAPRDYARLHWKWHRDKVLRAVNRQAPGALTLWPVMIAMSKEQSNATSNPRGVIETSIDDLAEEAMLDVKQVESILTLLYDHAEMVELSTGRMGVVHITLMRFGDWQVPRGSKAEHQQVIRDRAPTSREKASERGGDVESPSLSFTETETETVGQTSMSVVAPTTAVVKKPRPKPEDDPQVVKCFEWYCEEWGKTGNFAIELSSKRARAIQSALSKHGPKVVATVLRGFRTDEWRVANGLKVNDITKLLRPENIEVGMELAAKAVGLQQGGSVVTSPEDEMQKAGY